MNAFQLGYLVIVVYALAVFIQVIRDRIRLK